MDVKPCYSLLLSLSFKANDLERETFKGGEESIPAIECHFQRCVPSVSGIEIKEFFNSSTMPLFVSQKWAGKPRSCALWGSCCFVSVFGPLASLHVHVRMQRASSADGPVWDHTAPEVTLCHSLYAHNVETGSYLEQWSQEFF